MPVTSGDVSAQTRRRVVRTRLIEGAITVTPFVIAFLLSAILISNASIKIYVSIPIIAVLFAAALEVCARMDHLVEGLRFRLLNNAQIHLADWLAQSCSDRRMLHSWCDYDIGAAVIGDSAITIADWDTEYRMIDIPFVQMESVQFLRGSPVCRIVIKYADAYRIECVKYLSFQHNLIAMQWNATLRQEMALAAPQDSVAG